MKRFLRSQLELSNSQFGDNATILQGDVFHHDTSDLPKPPRSVVRIIPYPRNRHLVHRPDLMNKLNALLPQRSHSYNAAAIWGPAGTGKTQIALDYAYQRCDNNTSCSVFWVHAENEATFLRDYKIIAREFGINEHLKSEDLLAAVRDEIAAQLDWALIVDNADDLRLFGVWEEASHEKLINYIPRAATGTVLWTTCDPYIAGTLVSPRHGIEVSCMKPDEAEELLAISRYVEMNEEEEKVETAALLEELHWLPLFITHVGAYMKRTSTSPKHFLSLLAKERGVFNAVEGSRERDMSVPSPSILKQRLSQIAEELRICHFLVPIKRNANFISREPTLSKLLKRIQPDTKKDDCQRTVIEGFEGVGKTQIALEASYLVHEKNPFCSVFWVTAANATAFKRDYYDIGKKMKIEGIDEDGAEVEKLVKTALSAESSGSWLLVIDDADNLEPLGLSAYLPFSRNGSILFALRNVEAAAKLYIPKENIFPIEGLDIEEALNLWQKVFKESRTSSVRDTQRLSDFLRKSIWNYEKQRRWMEAEKLEVGVMEVLREFLGDKHSDTLSSMRNLASIYNRQGRYREAEALTAHIIGLLMETLGDDHPDTLLSMHKLASIYEKQGRYIEAQALEVQVLEVLRKTLGDKHRSTLSSMSNLAWIYKQQGRYIDAEELVALVIELRKEVLGGEHPAVMASMSSLASIYEKQNRYIEAEALELQVLGVLRKTLGHKNHNVLSSMHNLALVYEKQGRLREAEALEVQVLEFRKEILGGDNPDTLSSIHSLALIYEKQGRLREAEVLEEQAMRLYTGILGVDHLITLSSINDLASIYEKQGRHIEAEALKEQVIKGYQMVIEADDDRMLEGMHRLAPIYMQMGRQEDAEKLKTRILEIREARLDHFLQYSPLKGKPRDAEGDSGYGSASRRATTTILSVSDLQNDINVIASVERVEIKDDIRMQSDDDIRSVVSVDDDIRSQTSDATSNEGMTGKALIRTILAEQPQFKALCEKALDKMNRQRFVKNMSRLLKSFHICLAKEAESEAEKAVAELLRSKKGRQRISKQLVSHISMEKEEALDFGQSDLEIPLSRRVNVENWLSQIAKKVPQAEDSESAEQDQDSDSMKMELEDTYSFPYISQLKTFLSESKAFQSLQMQFALMFVSADLGYMLQSIPKENIWLSQEQDVSVSNRFKALVESTTKVRWNWWPLSPRKRMLIPGESRLFWQCTCGTEQWEEISSEQRELVENILKWSDNSPPFVSRCGMRRVKTTLLFIVKGILQFTGEQIALPSRAATRYTPQGDSSSTPPENQQYRLTRAVTLPQPQGPTISQHIQEKTPDSTSNQQWWILFGVKGARRTLEPTQIHVTSQTTDGDIFQELKRSYKIYRGRLRLWFSVWRLEYCDVVKFSRLAPDRIVREHRDLPLDEDYHYDPRAGARDARNPPISPHHFQTLFYACCSPCTWPFPHDCIPVLANTYNLTRIPKRTREFESDPNSPIWGFETVFAVSFGYVLAYHCLMVAGPFIFWGLWLKFHPDDLQNASVPITVVIGALSLFWSGAGILTSRERE